MEPLARAPEDLLRRSLESGRVHSAYLLSGPGEAPRCAALRFARAVVCRGSAERPCEACGDCRRSRGGRSPDGEAHGELALDGSGRKGPLFRHVGDHPDLFWVERGGGDTRVRIGQIRALQAALRLQANEGGWRAAVIADAEWLNQEAQNALLRLLEEPPDRTTLVLVAGSGAGLLATVRSRCQRVAFPAPDPASLLGPAASPAVRELAQRFEEIGSASIPELLDWAESYRGARAGVVENVEELLATGSAWLHGRVRRGTAAGARDQGRALEAFGVLSQCRKALAQRNANPQMVAERALLALREASGR